MIPTSDTNSATQNTALYSTATTKISSAMPADIPGIIAVLQQNLISSTHPFTASSKDKGFLIYGFTAEDVAAWLKDSENFIVLVSKTADNMVTSYAVSFNFQILSPHLHSKISKVITQQNLSTTEKILYYRHIAKIPGEKGLGTKLLTTILQQAALQGYQYIVGLIVHEPILNVISTALHKKMGFHLLDTIEDDGYLFGVYLKQLI